MFERIGRLWGLRQYPTATKVLGCRPPPPAAATPLTMPCCTGIGVDAYQQSFYQAVIWVI